MRFTFENTLLQLRQLQLHLAHDKCARLSAMRMGLLTIQEPGPFIYQVIQPAVCLLQLLHFFTDPAAKTLRL